MRHQHLHEHREHGEQHGQRRAGQHEPLQVVQQLEVGVALQRLHHHAGQHRDEQRGRQDERDRNDLRDDERPVRRRRRVDDLVDAAVAVAPDQFAGVEDRDDDRDDREGAVQVDDHQPRHREDLAAVELPRVPERAERVQHADAEQHEERRAAEHEGHVEARQPPELLPAGGQARDGSGKASARRRAPALRRVAPGLPAASAGSRRFPPASSRSGRRRSRTAQCRCRTRARGWPASRRRSRATGRCAPPPSSTW